MKVHFLGGADEIGASSCLVEVAGRRLLVDAGVRMGAKVSDRLPHLSLIDEVGGLDAILVTHAHLDHSGALPLVHTSFPEVPVVTTAPTLALLRVLLLDALKVMEVKAEQEEEIPLYPRPAVEALLGRTLGVGFLEPVPLCDGALRATFFPAGHVLGAAAIGLETPEGNLLISGDVSLADQLTVTGMPRPAFSPDLFVCESTYGSRLHASRRVEEERLARAVVETLREGGSVLIPAFALGRAQEVILVLRRALAARDAPQVTVHVDGMVRAINAVYGSHTDALSPRLRDRAQSGRGLFYPGDGRIRPVGSPQERESIVESGPTVIVASSGMLAGGPSSFYASRLATSAENLIAITGYQDEEAPGRRLQELADGERSEIALQGAKVKVSCRVATFGLSAHADAQELAGLATVLRSGAVALVHGDEDARAGLAVQLRERGLEEIHLPAAGDAVEVTKASAQRRARREVKGIADGRPFDVSALAELHKLHWSEGRPVGKTYSAHDLATEWFGSHGVPTDLADARRLLDGGQPFFIADRKRPFLYRRSDGSGESTPASSSTDDETPPRLEQNAALAVVDELFDAEARLLRRGAERETWTLRLTFDFPDVARERNAETLTKLEELTGWAVEVNPEANLAAFPELLRQRLPAGRSLVRPPSVRKEEKLVKVRVDGSLEDDDKLALEARFERETGFNLEVEASASATPRAKPDKVFDSAGRMEINMTFAEIDQAFRDLDHRPYKKSKMQDEQGPYLMLSFVSPEVGLRYEEVLDELEERTGWSIELSKKVDQQAVIQAARELLPERWSVKKGPGLDVANRAVIVKLAETPPAEELESASAALDARVGFRFKLKS